jgi:hypothetical protein
MTRASILVFSTDPLAAALVGACIELAGFEPVFAHDEENPRDILLRVRPRLVLVDCDHEGACTESFLGPVLMTGARILVFSSRRSKRQSDKMVQQFGVRSFTLPIEYDELLRLLTEEAAV